MCFFESVGVYAGHHYSPAYNIKNPKEISELSLHICYIDIGWFFFTLKRMLTDLKTVCWVLGHIEIGLILKLYSYSHILYLCDTKVSVLYPYGTHTKPMKYKLLAQVIYIKY